MRQREEPFEIRNEQPNSESQDHLYPFLICFSQFVSMRWGTRYSSNMQQWLQIGMGLRLLRSQILGRSWYDISNKYNVKYSPQQWISHAFKSGQAFTICFLVVFPMAKYNPLPSFRRRHWLWYLGVGDLPWQHQAANVRWHCRCYMHRNPEVCIMNVTFQLEKSHSKTVLCMCIRILFHESCSLILVNTAVSINRTFKIVIFCTPHLGHKFEKRNRGAYFTIALITVIICISAYRSPTRETWHSSGPESWRGVDWRLTTVSQAAHVTANLPACDW